MLVENDKRDEYKIKLPYSKREFSIPSNLYIIGTMNTADRSLALVDYAMRRRFSFITLVPAYDTEKFNDYLSNQMNLTDEMVNFINERMVKVNSLIEKRLGKEFLIGHSYFIDDKDNIKDSMMWFNQIVRYEIMPMIEEYFFDDEQTVKEIADILGGSND